MQTYLKQNTINNCIFTLREKSLLWQNSGITPYYLFQFISQTSRQEVLFVANNLSSLSAQNSYDEFNIICTGATQTNFSAGTIHLNPASSWRYNVYEQLNQYNFDVNQCISRVETGMVIYSSATQDFTYIKMTGDSNYIAFNTYQ